LPSAVYPGEIVILCRFNDRRLGLVADDVVRDVTGVLDSLPECRYPYPVEDVFIKALPKLLPRISEFAKGAAAVPVSSVSLLSPVANPGKIVAAPLNYVKHSQEVAVDANLHHQNTAHLRPIREAGLFLKATSSLVGASQGVVVRHHERRTDHEVELAVVIGKETREVKAKDALDYIAGYSIGLDMTVRGSEDRSFRKSIDTYTVLGPWLVTTDEVKDPSKLELWITVNGELRQKATTAYLILSVPELMEFASSFYTLYPGDILLTGTPEGVGPIAPGDKMRAYVERIGEMEVLVR
jgi:2-keto-4-pentenoate hydratase/2-oxohepta-3-ene-1,7-dioic acid hydratase in catechol pathway